MKINKNTNLLKNTKKFVYVSAITGVLLAGTQAGYLASTYTAHAEENVQSSVVNVNFVDQFGNPIQKSYGDNQVTTASYEISVEANATRSRDYFTGILQIQFPGVSTADNNIPENVDLSKPATYTFRLVQPTHTLTVNLVDGANNVVNTKTIEGVTNYGKSDISDLFNWANAHNYNTNGFPTLVSNNETVKNIAVSTNSDANNPVVSAQSSSATQQSSASSQPVVSSAVASSSQVPVQSSSSIPVSHSVKPESQSSVVSSSATQSSSAQSSALPHTDTTPAQAPHNDVATSRPFDPANPGEEKKIPAVKRINQAPVVFKQNKQAKKLPQTGDNTHQARAIALGVATIAVGIGVAYYGLRRKNK